MSEKLFTLASKALYVIAALVLLLLSLTMVGMAVWSIIDQLLAGKSFLQQILQSVGLIIISIAVFDVAKFLMEEEVLRDKELRTSAEARRSLTKFMTIIIIAVSLESLVIIFETSREQVTNLIYPAFLLLATILAIVGLAAFQWMSRKAEESAPMAEDNEE